MSTIKEVARRAKVSPTTVSFILNNSDRVRFISSTTKRRVLRAAEQLHYQPNILARTLRTKKSNTFGVIALDLADPCCGQIIQGMEAYLHPLNYLLLLSDIQNLKRIEDYLNNFRERQVEGILLIANTLSVTDSTLRRFIQGEIPTVVIGRKVENAPCVTVDNKKGAYLATEYLIKQGHKRIGFILGPQGILDARQREEGAKSCLKDYGLRYNREWTSRIPTLNPNPRLGYQTTQKLLKKDCTAICTFDDISAMGAIRAAIDYGKRVPEDISVIGFDDIPPSAYYNPPLTTVRHPTKAMGREAAKILVGLVQEKTKRKKLRRVDNLVILKPKLIVRKSTGKAKN